VSVTVISSCSIHAAWRNRSAFCPSPCLRLSLCVFEFWLKIFGVAFGLGVVSGIVMAFQFGTNWSELSRMSGPKVGAVDIDVGALGVDFAVGGMLKYLLDTAGIGFLYVARRHIAALTPTVSGWFAQADIAAMDIFANTPFGTSTQPIEQTAPFSVEEAAGLREISAAHRAVPWLAPNPACRSPR
jgi:hypothetical protein